MNLLIILIMTIAFIAFFIIGVNYGGELGNSLWEEYYKKQEEQLNVR